MDRGRYEPIVVCPEQGPFVDELMRLGVAVHVIPTEFGYRLPRSLASLCAFGRRLASMIRFSFGVARLLREQSVDLVHVNTIVQIPGAVGAKIARKPIVWYILEPLETNLKTRLAAWLAETLADRLVVVSHAISTELQRVSLKPPPTVYIVHLGLDLRAFEAEGANVAQVRSRWNIQGSQPVVGLVGNIIPRKGTQYFIQAAHLVLQRYPDARFLVVGDSPDFAREYGLEIRKFCRVEGLDKAVVFTGFRRDIPAIMQACDVMVLASLQDPFPWVVLEAMAAGKPVVATNVEGVPEAVVHGKTGFLVPPADPQAMAEAIMTLLDDPKRAREMGAAGKARVRQEFTRQAYVGKMESIYADLLAAQF